MQGGASNGPCRLRFGLFEVDISTKELYKRGLLVRLESKPFQILAMLAERPDKVVTREELQRRLWPANTFVEFDEGLNTAIKKLRQALGDSASSPRFIETLPRQGYRFIAPVERVQPEGARVLPVGLMAQQGRQPGAAAAATPRRLVPPPAVLIGTALLAMALVLGWRRWPWRMAPPLIRSVAVLPLENLSDDPTQEYFADGMTDELITDLGRIAELRVVSRTSVMQYKRTHKPLAQIARELNVDAVLEGTVLRSGNRVRITAQLIQVPTDKHLWAESYEGDLYDVLELQDKVASAVAAQIRVRLSPQEQLALKRGRVVDPEAHEAYLKGSYFAEKRTADGITKAISYFEQAIHADPNFALPYAGLAQAYAILPDYVAAPPRESYTKAKVAAAKALELDETLAEAHAALAVLLGNNYDWAGYDHELRRAIELNPSYATAYHWHALSLVDMGRWNEAISQIERARELDPLSIIINANVGFVFYYAREFDRAIEAERKALELDRNAAVAYDYLGLAYLQKRMYREATADLQKAVDLNPEFPPYGAELAYAYAAGGNSGPARRILMDLEDRSRRRYVYASSLAVVYTGLGESNAALGYLEKAYGEGDPMLQMLKVNPLFDVLHPNPRFQDLVRRIGLAP